MRPPSLMMYIFPALLLVFYGYVGFCRAAPRSSADDASPMSRKPVSASDTWGDLRTGKPAAHRLLKSQLAPGALTPAPAVAPGGPSRPVLTFQLPDPTAADGKNHLPAPESRLAAPRKRSTDALTLFAPDKTLQTMVSMVSPRSANDAWSADSIGASPTSMENSQDAVCNCSSGAEGILDPDECDQRTGQCVCLSGYGGLQCDDCEDGYFTNGTSGCLPCACDSFGAVDHLCDSSGMCVCKTGVYGPKCDECHPGFFHFSSTGCRPCQCHNHTSSCHPQSGVCLNCEGDTQGSNCEECKSGFFRSPDAALTTACVSCPCPGSSSTGTCHTEPGGSPVCDQCLHWFTGPRCDQCAAGFFRSSGACVPCDCSGNADPQGPPQRCHPDTGHCLRCINNTAGPQCQLCAPGYTGDARAHNCTLLAPRILVTTATTANISATFSPSPSSTFSPSSSSSSSASSTTQALLTSLSSPTDNTTAALTDVSWTQFNIIILAVIILVVVLLLGFVGGVYTYREYQNRKLNAPFWTIELKEDNISFSSYHDSIPNADVSGLLEDETNEVAPNGTLALTAPTSCYAKA